MWGSRDSGWLCLPRVHLAGYLTVDGILGDALEDDRNDGLGHAHSDVMSAPDKCPFTAMIQRGKLGVSSVASPNPPCCLSRVIAGDPEAEHLEVRSKFYLSEVEISEKIFGNLELADGW